MHKNSLIKLSVFVVLIAAFFTLSAFTGKSNYDSFAKRYEFALLIEDVLFDEVTCIEEDPYLQEKFNDLTYDEIKRIELTIRAGIMNGFPDGSFRPDEPIRNVETVEYLRKLRDFLTLNAKKSYAAKQLDRLFLTLKRDKNSKGFISSFLEKNADYSNIDEVCEVFNILKKENPFAPVSVVGCFVDKVSGSPLKNVFASIEGIPVKSESNGIFRVELPKGIKCMKIFAAAEGYKSVEFSKDVTFNRNPIIYMYPVHIK